MLWFYNIFKCNKVYHIFNTSQFNIKTQDIYDQTISKHNTVQFLYKIILQVDIIIIVAIFNRKAP